MITYDPLWETMREKGITTYYLIEKGVSKGTIHRLKHNMPSSTQTIDTLCKIIGCTPSDILSYIPDTDT